ncbi:MAG TPA: hypothetical protein V6C57_09565 [Coleofasciculaceae cyanobacterium]
MSSDESKSPRSPKTSSSRKVENDALTSSSSHFPSSAETSSAETMDQHLDSALIAPPPAPLTPPEVMSSTVPDPADIAVNPAQAPVDLANPPSPQVDVVKTDAAQADAAQTDTAKTDAAQANAAKTDAAQANADESHSDEAQTEILRQQPIPPASEPMQYRAIGLVRGKYAPSDEQFTRGFLHTDDGVAIDAVLLGRVMSLVKKHLDLEQSHLWVVYPRTREKDYDLHVQIVGVWEPENLNQVPSEDEADHEAEAAEAAETIEAAEASVAEDVAADTAAKVTPAVAKESTDHLDDRYFSVRGEVVLHSPENEQVLVKIRRAPAKGDKQSKAFKVVLRGVLEGSKSLGYFWDFQVQRQGNILTIQDATLIKMVPPQKGEGGSKFGRGGPRRGGFAPPGRQRYRDGAPAPRREGGTPRPSRPVGDRPANPTRPVAPQRDRKEPATKPILKRRDKDASES